MQNKNWKTTLAGVATILGALAHAASKISNGEMPSMDDMIALMAGFGLLFAKDHNVTGGSVQQ